MTAELMEFNVMLAHGIMTVGMLVLAAGLGVAFLHLCGKLLEKIKAVRFGLRLYFEFWHHESQFEAVIDRIEKEMAKDGIW